MAENYFGLTDTGKLRDNNEDAFIAQKLSGNGLILACVIDGVGGYEGGEVAAAITREALLKQLNKPESHMQPALKEALHMANESIFVEKQKNKKYESMACVLTLAMVDVPRHVFYYAHVGDTRLYLLRDNSLVKVTKDQSFVGFLEDSGRLTEQEAMTHPKRNEINNALGFTGQININSDYIETGESPFLPGDHLLLCSDGLTDMVSSSEITAILSKDMPLNEKAIALIAAANTAGGKDNITVVLVYNDAAPVKQRATKPASSLKKKQVRQTEADPAELKNDKPAIIPLEKKDNSKTIILLLSLLSGALLLGILWLLLKQPKHAMITAVTKASTQDSVQVTPNQMEKTIADSITNVKGHTLLIPDSVFEKPVVLSNSLFINRDSFYLRAKNKITLVSDSAFSGPAIVLAPACKYILLENITLKNFDIGILAQNKALHLRNVRFENCRIPLQYQFSFPANQYINGYIGDKALFQWDSIPKNK